MDTSSKPQQRRGPAVEPEADGALQLARLCCAQLDREQAHLETARAVLRQVYAAALASKPQPLADLLARQKSVAQDAESVRAERARFRAQAAAVLGTSADTVTLREIARHLPAGIAQLVLQRRQELHRLSGEVQGIGRDIALFSHYFLDFLERFFIQLTGGRNSGRYGPEGLRREAVCGSLLQAQG
jgi:hypothetical protein